jgi:hypothetical protein
VVRRGVQQRLVLDRCVAALQVVDDALLRLERQVLVVRLVLRSSSAADLVARSRSRVSARIGLPVASERSITMR